MIFTRTEHSAPAPEQALSNVAVTLAPSNLHQFTMSPPLRISAVAVRGCATLDGRIVYGPFICICRGAKTPGSYGGSRPKGLKSSEAFT